MADPLEQLARLPPAQQQQVLTQLRAADPKKYAEVANAITSGRVAQENYNAVVDQADIEDRFGGRVVTDKPIGSMTVRARMGVREELGRKIDVATRSGELPEGTEATGVRDRSGNIQMAYTKPGSNEFNLMDDPNSFDRGDIGEIASSVINGEMLGAIAGEMLGAKGAGLVPKFLRWAAPIVGGGVGAAAGRAADETMEGFTDGELQDLDAVLAKAGESGAFGAIGAGAGKVVERLNNARKGRGLVSPDLYGDGAEAGARRDVIEAAREEGFAPPSLGDLGHPIINRAERQAEGFSQEAKDRSAAKLRTPAERLIAEREGVEDISELSDEALERVFDAEEKKARDTLRRGLRDKGFPADDVSREAGGQAVADTIETYATVSKEQTDRLYSQVMLAAQDEGISFDLKPLKEWAAEELDNFKLAGKPTETEVPSTIVGSNGKPLSTETVVSQNDVEFQKNHEGKLREVLGLINKADATQGPEHFSALRQLRTLLGDLGQAAPGTNTRNYSQGQGSRGFGILTKILREDAGGSEALRTSQKLADDAWKGRQRTLDGFRFTSQMGEMGGGERIYNHLVGSGNLTAEQTDFLWKAMPVDRRREFQAAVIRDIQRNPGSARSTIKALGDSAERIIPDDVRVLLRRYERDMKNVGGDVLMQVYQKQADNAARVAEIVEKNGATELRSLIDAGEITADSVRTSIFDRIVRKTTEIETGLPQIKPQSVQPMIDELKQKGLWGLLSDSQRRLLTNTQLYSSFIKSASDSGDSIASAALASKSFHLATDPTGAMKAAGSMIQIGSIARMSNSAKAISVIQGLGDAPVSMPKIRASVVATSILARNLLQETEE